MTTVSRLDVRSLGRLLVALLVLVAVFASGVGVAEAQNGVAAINPDPAPAVEAAAEISSGHVGSETGLFGEGVSGCCVAPRTAQPGTALQPYYPANNGFYGTPKATTLRPGAAFDRYGSDFGRFASPTGTPIHHCALPPGAEDGAYSAFRVVEPLAVQSGRVAPAFESFGGGTQYLLPKSVKELLGSGVIERVTP